MNLHEFHCTDSQNETAGALETQPVAAGDILDEVRKLTISGATDHQFKVSTICLLKGLRSMSSMNGKKCRVIGPLHRGEQRYPVFVYETNDIVLIKPSNLTLATADRLDSAHKSRRERIREILEISNGNRRQNVAPSFAAKVMRQHFNLLNTDLMDDFKRVLQGNCVYIPHFLCSAADFRLLEFLKQDIERIARHSVGDGMVDWSRHSKHENPSFSETFSLIADYLASYFSVEIYASRLNLYRNGADWKPFHHDSHAFCSGKEQREDFTVGVSFGQQRVLSFKHVRTGEVFDVPQRNGDCFAFNSIVNRKFQHGILKGAANLNERFSVILWGKRRSLNERNSGRDERERGRVFKGRHIM